MTGQTKTPRGAARGNILRAAAELFSASGVRAVGVDAVAERAGVAKVTLFRHFPTKAELVTAALAEADAHVLEFYRAAMRRAGDDPAARILSVFDGLDDLAQHPGYRGCLFINTGLALADDDHPAHKPVARHKEALRELLADELRSAGHPEPDAASEQLLLLVDGALVAGALRPASHPARAARSLAEEVLARCTR